MDTDQTKQDLIYIEDDLQAIPESIVANLLKTMCRVNF